MEFAPTDVPWDEEVGCFSPSSQLQRGVTDWHRSQEHFWQKVRRSRRPWQGIYYWLPRPAGGWRLAAWLTPSVDPSELRQLHHRLVWAQVIEHLASLWRAPLDVLRNRIQTLHAGIPRGRVGNTYFEYWVIARGETDIVPREEDRLQRAFHLQGRKVRVLMHDHWDVLPEERRTVMATLHELKSREEHDP